MSFDVNADLFFCFSVKVCEMMFSLASKLATARTSGSAFLPYAFSIVPALPPLKCFMLNLIKMITVIFFRCKIMNFSLC